MLRMPDAALLVFLLVVYPCIDTWLVWPRTRRRIVSGAPGARLRMYRELLLTLWAGTIAYAAWWNVNSPGAIATALRLPSEPASVLTLVLLAALVLLLRTQLATIAKLDAARRARIVARLGEPDLLVARTPQERSVYFGVALTAGICEEFLYRGWALTTLTPLCGVWGAAAITLAGFVAAHAYQGREKLPNIAIVGGLLTVLTVFAHSIVPAIVLHAMVDILGGESGYALHRDPGGEAAA